MDISFLFQALTPSANMKQGPAEKNVFSVSELQAGQRGLKGFLKPPAQKLGQGLTTTCPVVKAILYSF